MSMTLDPSEFEAVQRDVDRAAQRQRIWFWGILALILAYLTFSWVQFDIGSLREKWRPERAALFVLDTYAHKDHVTMRWETPDEIRVAFEGGHRQVYDPKPEWFTEGSDGGRTIEYGNGGLVTFYDDVIALKWPDQDEIFEFRLNANNKPYVVGYENRLDDLPDWIRQTENKVEIRPSLFERLQIGTLKVEAHRYEVGWKYFWFDFDSPLVDYGFFSGIALMFSPDRVVPEMSNAKLVWTEFRDNSLWGHGTVLYAMLETIFMALLGTMIAAGVGLPLAFMAARNVQPIGIFRFALRRLFRHASRNRHVDLVVDLPPCLWAGPLYRHLRDRLYRHRNARKAHVGSDRKCRQQSA